MLLFSLKNGWQPLLFESEDFGEVWKLFCGFQNKLPKALLFNETNQERFELSHWLNPWSETIKEFNSLNKLVWFLYTGEAATADSIGREFVFAYPTPFLSSSYSPTFYVVITNPTSSIFSVDVNLITINPPSASLVRSVAVTNSHPANITITAREYYGSSWRTSGATNLPLPTVKITAQGDAIVHAYYSYNERYTGWYAMGTLVLPTTALGKDHFIASYKPWNRTPWNRRSSAPRSTQYSEITVTAIAEETSVTIRAKDGISNWRYLRPYESFQYKSLVDLTGSRVKANKPVAVMAGVSAAMIPTTVSYANYLLAQMPSVEGLGKTYILSPFRERASGYVFRVVATQDNTFVSISDRRPVEYHSGEVFDQDVPGNNITLISSDKPVLVAQYNKGYTADGIRGNAAMVVVPAVEMFSSTVMFPVTSLQSKATKSYYLSIVIRCAHTPGLTVDGAKLGKFTF